MTNMPPSDLVADTLGLWFVSWKKYLIKILEKLLSLWSTGSKNSILFPLYYDKSVSIIHVVQKYY